MCVPSPLSNWKELSKVDIAAGQCDLISESGAAVSFSKLVRERERVVVVFLRHLWVR